MTRAPATAVVLAMLAAGCGSGSSGGSSTPAPSGTITAIEVKSTGPTLFLGTTETFTAVATLSTGATTTLSLVAWSTSAAGVATVDASSGRVLGVANGEVTISAEYQGVRGSKMVRVVPNYGGAWLGMYSVVTCTQTEGFADADYCAGFPPRESLQYGLELQQNADVVSGHTTLGRLGSTDFTASIAADGTLTFMTQVFIGTLKIDEDWALASTQGGVITGTIDHNWMDLNTPGEMNVHGTLLPPMRQAAASIATTHGGVRRTLAEALAAVTR